MARSFKRQGKGMAAVVLPQLRRIGHHAVDRATLFAKDETRTAIRNAGLGRLAGAVGSQSSIRGKAASRAGITSNNIFGVIYARGRATSRANKALLAYSQGASIFPTAGRKWLAFPTDAIPKLVGRELMTPAKYRASGLVASVGRLQFVPGKNGKEAFLVARKVTVSRRTRRAKAFTGRVPRGADRKDGVVVFILIRWTKRAQRFDQPTIMRKAQARIPFFAAQAQQGSGAA